MLFLNKHNIKVEELRSHSNEFYLVLICVRTVFWPTLYNPACPLSKRINPVWNCILGFAASFYIYIFIYLHICSHCFWVYFRPLHLLTIILVHSSFLYIFVFGASTKITFLIKRTKSVISNVLSVKILTFPINNGPLNLVSYQELMRYHYFL